MYGVGAEQRRGNPEGLIKKRGRKNEKQRERGKGERTDNDANFPGICLLGNTELAVISLGGCGK